MSVTRRGSASEKACFALRNAPMLRRGKISHGGEDKSGM
jgi:hypothetical protein